MATRYMRADKPGKTKTVDESCAYGWAPQPFPQGPDAVGTLVGRAYRTLRRPAYGPDVSTA